MIEKILISAVTFLVEFYKNLRRPKAGHGIGERPDDKRILDNINTGRPLKIKRTSPFQQVYHIIHYDSPRITFYLKIREHP